MSYYAEKKRNSNLLAPVLTNIAQSRDVEANLNRVVSLIGRLPFDQDPAAMRQKIITEVQKRDRYEASEVEDGWVCFLQVGFVFGHEGWNFNIEYKPLFKSKKTC